MNQKIKDKKQAAARPAAEEPAVKDSSLHELQVFLKNGGSQPALTDEDAINHFFGNNYAKVWAMTMGFTSIFREYKDGVICFDLITDPRFKGHDYMLSRFVAAEYKKKVTLLKDAISYEAKQFNAKDIIGFRLEKGEEGKLSEYFQRVEKAYAGLSKKWNQFHSGKF